MRTLILNKFLHRNGGSETYIFKLGEALEQHGHEVQYFGMEHEGRCVGNRVNAYTSLTVSLFRPTVSSPTASLICAKSSRRSVFVSLSRVWSRPTTRSVVCRTATSVVTAH